MDASKIIFSHTDIYKGRIASLVWELIDLPHPQYVHYPDMPPFRVMGTDLHKNIAIRNREAMLGINHFRQMGEAGMKSANESRAMAFDIDENLRKGNWVAAEKGIREITKLGYFYSGWFVNIGLGLVRKGFSIGSSDVSTIWYPLSKASIHTLLVYVLVKQDKCDEAAQVMDEYVRPSLLYQNEEKKFLEVFESYKVRLLNCHE